MSDTPRFTYAPQGRYWIVTDGETGAQWPYDDEAAAIQRVHAANEDATVMRSQIAAAPSETLGPINAPNTPDEH